MFCDQPMKAEMNFPQYNWRNIHISYSITLLIDLWLILRRKNYIDNNVVLNTWLLKKH